MDKAIIAFGVWILSDGIYSWFLYANAETYGSDKKQTFWRDHWIRLVRMICGLSLLIIGFIR